MVFYGFLLLKKQHVIGFVLLRKRLQGEIWKKKLALNLRKMKNETLHDFDGFLPVGAHKDVCSYERYHNSCCPNGWILAS